MEVSRTRALRGPNMWSRHTAIEAIVHCNEIEQSIANLPGFEARLRAIFPSIGALRPASTQQQARVGAWLRPAQPLRACRAAAAGASARRMSRAQLTVR